MYLFTTFTFNLNAKLIYWLYSNRFFVKIMDWLIKNKNTYQKKNFLKF